MSSHVPLALRQVVAGRSGHVCEYCLFPEADALFEFQIEHVISEKHGGPTEEQNLAYACVFCNRHKGSDIASLSPTTGQLVRLFNPRTDRWDDHFDLNGPFVVPRTEIGEVTIRLLHLNDETRVAEREVLQTLGRYPPRRSPA